MEIEVNVIQQILRRHEPSSTLLELSLRLDDQERTNRVYGQVLKNPNSTLIFSTCGNSQPTSQTVLTVYGVKNNQTTCLASNNRACLGRGELHLFGSELDPAITTLYVAVQTIGLPCQVGARGYGCLFIDFDEV